MPVLESAWRYQKAVLWERSATVTDDYGEQKIKAAVEIAVRWEEGRRDPLSPQENALAYDARAVVGQKVLPGSVLWLGTLATLPSPLVDLFTVTNYSETPDVKNRNVRRQVDLVRRSDSLPTLE